MARPFSEREREIIRQKLIDAGREAFGTFGLKKTSVDDLTQAVGISKGSFYAFFDSKEELYLEIIEAEESSFREQIMAQVLNNQPFTKHSLKAFILEGLRAMESNPLIRWMCKRDEFEQFLRAIPPEQLAQHIRADEDWMREVVAKWQEQGFIISADPRAVAGVIKLILTSTLFKDSLGGDSYPEAIDLLVDLVASGLVTKNQDT